MINHARTLLMNVSGNTSQRQENGEEYISPQFHSLTLPSYILSARRLLLGTNPDRYFLNHRVRELMHYLHQTELANYVYALDPRVTYWPETSMPFLDRQRRVDTAQILGPTSTRLFFNGALTADNARGRCLSEFIVSVVTDGPGIALLVEEPRRPAVTTAVPVVNELSGAVTLGQTGLSVRVSKPVAGSRWSVRTLAKPAPAITTVLPALEIIGEPTMLELFGVLTTEEPYATFRNLWGDNNNPVYRLGAFVLAVIYRTEEARKKDGNG